MRMYIKGELQHKIEQQPTPTCAKKEMVRTLRHGVILSSILCRGIIQGFSDNAIIMENQMHNNRETHQKLGLYRGLSGFMLQEPETSSNIILVLQIPSISMVLYFTKPYTLIGLVCHSSGLRSQPHLLVLLVSRE